MSISPDDFLKEAAGLIKERTDEMGIRLAINRAYYGAFHLAKSVVNLMPGYKPSNHDEPSHQELLNGFAVGKGVVFPGCQQAKQIHDALTQGRKLRKKADYILSDTLQPQQAAAVLFNAKKVQQLIPDLIKRRQST
jgi:uncharacterized protein (UPF0332 family)